MSDSLIYRYINYTKNIRVATCFVALVLFVCSCKSNKKEYVDFNQDRIDEATLSENVKVSFENSLRTKLEENFDKYRVVYKGEKGPGKSKHIVFIATDHEYRGEETLPALAKIMAKRYGFTCTVVWALDDQGNIFPGGSDLKGLKVLETADLMVIFTRFANFEDKQMQYIDDYLQKGLPVIGLRTSTHAFKNLDNPKWGHYDYTYKGEKKAWHGGFGELILGETWVGHYGKNHQQASKLITEEDNKTHPIMSGVENAWAQCGGYNAYPQGKDLKIVARGMVLNGMTPESSPDTTKEKLPVAWVRTYQLPSGKPGRAFTTTHGASEDILSEGFRRMLINACFWSLKMERNIKPNNPIDFVGIYKPTTFNFNGFQKNVKPSDLADWNSVIMPRKKLRNE